jgi:hypothetical protein
MLATSLRLDSGALERATGWSVRPEGLCKHERCVPLPEGADLRGVAGALGMALVEEPAAGLWALGPESGGRALTSAIAPDLVLPDLEGVPFALRSLRGSKVLLIAWASW